MVKFDSDFAIFGTIAGYIDKDRALSENLISYANNSFIKLYGDYKGKTILEFFTEVAGNAEEGNMLIKRLGSENALTAEGIINRRVVKCHSRLISSAESTNNRGFFQAAITDITELTVIKELYGYTSEALKRAAEAADEDTGHHIARMNRYSAHISVLMGKEEKFIDDISRYAQLHDIGKIKVAEIIRLPRKLTEDELVIMKKHTVYGAEIVEGMEGLEMAYNIALDHHEKWDGSGYPNKKEGDKISPEGRIVAMADIFDALVSERPYKPAFDYKKSFKVITEGDGRVMPEHFDPEVHKVFVSNYDDFVDLHKELKG